MIKRTSYKGTLNGIFGIWIDKKPDGIELQEEITFYMPAEGKIFKKGDEYFDCVIINNGVKIEDYEEVDVQKNEEQAQM